MKYRGKTHKVGDHIDTDAIIPARFLITADPEKLGANCMAGLDPDWVKKVKKGDILVVGKNFGCGSSREHAPIAILGAGIPVVIGQSFARIFYRNAFNMGLPLLEVGDEISEIGEGDELEIDIEQGTINNLTTGKKVAFKPLPSSMREILAAGGLVGYVKQRMEREKSR